MYRQNPHTFSFVHQMKQFWDHSPSTKLVWLSLLLYLVNDLVLASRLISTLYSFPLSLETSSPNSNLIVPCTQWMLLKASSLEVFWGALVNKFISTFLYFLFFFYLFRSTKMDSFRLALLWPTNHQHHFRWPIRILQQLHIGLTYTRKGAVESGTGKQLMM